MIAFQCLDDGRPQDGLEDQCACYFFLFYEILCINNINIESSFL